MRKTTFILVVLLIIASLMLGGCNSTPSSTTTPITQETSVITPNQMSTTTPSETLTSTPTQTIKTTPASFKVTSMDVTPIVAEPGQAVTVEVKVMNEGGTAGSSRQALTINGIEIEAREVTVAPSNTNTVTFTVTENISGLYEIKVAGLTETVRVKQLGSYPRLSNIYIAWEGKTPTANFLWHPEAEPTPRLKSLAIYDIIGIPYNVAFRAPESIRQLKILNPRIKILALLWVGESDFQDLKTEQELHEDWYLHKGNTPGSLLPAQQRRVSFMKVMYLMNPASGWSTFAPTYVHDKIMASGLFDGVLFDMMLDLKYMSGSDVYGLDVNSLDIDNDGITDNPEIVKQKYNDGMTNLLKLTRELCGPETIIIGNCEWGPDSSYFAYANGDGQENAFGTRTWDNHNFAEVWDEYQRNMRQPSPPTRIHGISMNADGEKYDDIKPELPPADLQKMSYGLAIALLDDGYFGFAGGNPSTCELWWFPEYNANLGLAKGKAQQRSDGTWTREFENGVVLVNSTTIARTIEFTDIYQDVTTGEKGTRFVVQPSDGRIFIKSA